MNEYAVVYKHLDFLGGTITLFKTLDFACDNISQAYKAGMRHIAQFHIKKDKAEIINIFKIK